MGITNDTCHINADVVRDKTVILIDDIYTKTVNVDEDCGLWHYMMRAQLVLYSHVLWHTPTRRSSYRKGA